MQLFLSSSFSRGLSSFFAFFITLFYFCLKGGGCKPCNITITPPPHPLDPPIYGRSVPECISCALSSEHFLTLIYLFFNLFFCPLTPTYIQYRAMCPRLTTAVAQWVIERSSH